MRSFRNREGVSAFDFTLPATNRTPGVSALVRVRNEERYVGRALRSLLGRFDEIVVVDNASEDGTVAIVERVRDTEEGGERIGLHSYPHRLARFGSEHERTPVNSLHSATYFTNWCLSRCRYRYACKWDGDMILRADASPAFERVLERVRRRWIECWALRGQTVYESSDGSFWLDPEEVNAEIELFPCGSRFRFVEHPRWEQLRRPFYAPKRTLEPVCFLEMKHVGDDEFSHWSEREWTTERKRREWENFHRVRDGDPGDRLTWRHSSFLEDEAAG